MWLPKLLSCHFNSELTSRYTTKRIANNNHPTPLSTILLCALCLYGGCIRPKNPPYLYLFLAPILHLHSLPLLQVTSSLALPPVGSLSYSVSQSLLSLSQLPLSFPTVCLAFITFLSFLKASVGIGVLA